MEASTSRCHHYHSRRQKLNILTVLFVLHLALTGFLLFVLLYHRADLLQIIDGYKKDVDELRQQVDSAKSKPKSTFSEEKDNEQKSMGVIKSEGSSFANQKQAASPKSLKRSLQGNVNGSNRNPMPHSVNCPFHRSRKKKICSFVLEEVLKQRNITEDLLRKEIAVLRKQVESLDKTLKKSISEPANGYEKVHAHIPFMGTNVLKKVPGTEKDKAAMYGLKLRTMRTNCTPRNMYQFCRKFHNSGTGQDLDIDYRRSNITTKVLGFYWLSLQLTMKDISPNSNSFAHLVSKVSVVMFKDQRTVELLSQVPIPFVFSDGDEQIKLYSVSMSGQFKLYRSDCKLKVVVTLKSAAAVSTNMKVYLYQKDTMNWFDIKLMRRMENDS